MIAAFFECTGQLNEGRSVGASKMDGVWLQRNGDVMRILALFVLWLLNVVKDTGVVERGTYGRITYWPIDWLKI